MSHLMCVIYPDRFHLCWLNGVIYAQTPHSEVEDHAILLEAMEWVYRLPTLPYWRVTFDTPCQQVWAEVVQHVRADGSWGVDTPLPDYKSSTVRIRNALWGPMATKWSLIHRQEPV